MNFKKKSIKKLRDNFLLKTGIDFEEYRKPELIEKLSSLITFPLHAIKLMTQVFKWLFLALICVVLIWCFSTSKLFAGFIVFIIGFFFVFINSIFWGTNRLLRSTLGDLTDIATMSMDVAQSVMDDVSSVKNHAKKNAKLPDFTEIIKGTIQVAVLPSVLTIVKSKIPLVGTVIAKIIEQIFLIFTKNISEKETQIREEIGIDKKIQTISSNTNEYLNQGGVFLNKIKDQTEDFMDSAIHVISFPFRTIGFIVSFLSLLIIGIIFFLSF